MTSAPARVPADLPDLDPSWSRLVSIPDGDSGTIDVHVLDAGPRDAELTVVCVHGNPTWSYLWRGVIAQAPPNVRVIALDQVGMGYSARVPGIRRLAQRVDDLAAVITAMGVRGRIALLAHDWGGPIATAWVERAATDPQYAHRLAGIVLTNTAVHQASDQSAPRLILAARASWLRRAVTAKTTTFLRGTTAISKVDRAHARAFRAPYRGADRREAICDFVADIPFESDHPSYATLQEIAEGTKRLAGIRTLLVWGMRDPVFAPRYLDDLQRRLPHAQVHQFADAGHLVLEDRPDAIADIWEWLLDVDNDDALNNDALNNDERPAEAAAVESPLRHLFQLAGARGGGVAISEHTDQGWRNVSWALLADRVGKLASAFQQQGIAAGQRVSVLIPPGADLIATVYALWRLEATVVVIDAAHRPAAMIQALRGARVDHMIAIRRAAPVAFAVRPPGRVLWREGLARAVTNADPSPAKDPDDIVNADSDAVIVFTSGATGPAKPVAYSWKRLAATAATLQAQYGFVPDDVLIAAFAPWAVMGPLLGLASVIPQMDASRPGTLTADALAAASEQAGGTVMWASPAAMRSVLASAPAGSPERERLQTATSRMRLLMIAGAPVPRGLLSEIVECWPTCDVRTPYGMTEVLPATDVDAAEVLASDPNAGVLVGRPLPGVQIAIAPLDGEGIAGADLVETPGVLGEVAVRAAHGKSRYDARAFTERRSGRNPGWHRTGDVGRIDDEGRVWIDGRLAHVISTAQGPVGPVSVEQRVAAGLRDTQGVHLSVAAVGVGPRGAQVIVVVCAPDGAGSARRHSGVQLASTDLAAAVRALQPDIAAVLWCEGMPVDIRHGAKVDRALLAAEATELLAGHR